MLTRNKRSWVLLTSFAACAGLATTQAFAVEPRAETPRVHEPAQNIQSLYLIKLLEGSSQFRVRAQAAISLGLMERSPAARSALTNALRDAHPLVRAAAATSLGRIGEADQVSALRTLETDSEAPVRNAARASIAQLSPSTLVDASALAMEHRLVL